MDDQARGQVPHCWCGLGSGLGWRSWREDFVVEAVAERGGWVVATGGVGAGQGGAGRAASGAALRLGMETFL